MPMTAAERMRAYRARKQAARPEIQCASCGKRFRPKRSTAKYCSDKCRAKAHYEKGKRK